MSKLIKNLEENTLDLYVGGEAKAGWDLQICEFSKNQLGIIERMVDIGVDTGKKLKAEEIRKVLGM